MVQVNAVVGLGTKGSDLVLSTFKKINAQKEKFSKTTTGKIIASIGAGAAKALQPAEKSKEQQKKDQDQKETFERNRAVKAAHKVGDATEKLAGGFASLDPVNLIRSVAGSVIQAGGGLLSAVAGHFVPALGDAAKQLTEHVNKLIDFGITAASGSLNAVKQALPLAAQRQSERALLNFAGANKAINKASVSQTEAATLASSLLPVLGKIKPGEQIEKQLSRLFETINGQIVRRDQAMSLAQGDFTALGTDEGYFLNQISQSVSSLPPTLAKAFRGQLLSMVPEQGLDKEAAGFRIGKKQFEEQDLTAQANLANAALMQQADKKGVGDYLLDTNEKLNDLLQKMVNSAANLNQILGVTASKVNTVLSTIVDAVSGIETKKAK